MRLNPNNRVQPYTREPERERKRRREAVGETRRENTRLYLCVWHYVVFVVCSDVSSQKKTEWYLRWGTIKTWTSETKTQREQKRAREKNQSTWNVFIHLCQVNEHGIPVRCFHRFASSNRKLILYHQHRVPSTMALWLTLCEWVCV